MRALRFTTLVCVGLAGCTGLHERNVPKTIEATLPDHYLEQGQAPGAVPAVDSTWRQAFGDPALDALVEQGLRNNADLAVGAARLLEARALATQASAARFPVIGAFLAATRQRELNPIGPGTILVEGASFGGSASFELDLWGRLNATSVAARQRFLAQGFNFAALRLAIEAELVRGYLQLQAIEAQVGVLQESVGVLEDALRLSEQRFEAGSIAELEDSRARFSDSQQQARATRRALLIVAGLTPSPEVFAATQIQTQPRELASLPEIPVGLPSQLLSRRPDLRAAEAQLAGARADVAAARRAFLPSVTLTASGGKATQSLSSIFASGSAVWSIGADLAQTIFDGGARYARVRIAAAQRQALLETYRDAARSAYRDVLDALDARSAAVRTFEAREREARALERAVHLAERRYAEGYSGFLDVLDARRSLLQSRLALAQSRSAVDIAYVSLAVALGGGWTPAGS